MSSSGWEVLDVCGVENCRTKKYKRDTDGYLYCKNGHRHEVGLLANILGSITGSRTPQATLATGEDDGGYARPGHKVRKQEEQQEVIYQRTYVRSNF